MTNYDFCHMKSLLILPLFVLISIFYFDDVSAEDVFYEGIEIYAHAEMGSDIITIIGSTDIMSKDITLTVTAPNGNVVLMDQVSPMLNGEFTSVITTGGPLWKQDGIYTVTAKQSASSKYTASIEVGIQDGVLNENIKLKNKIISLEDENSKLQKDNFQLKVENRKLENNNSVLESQIEELNQKLDDLHNVIVEQIKVIMEILKELQNKIPVNNP